MEGVRLDTWLWSVRLYKTRNEAVKEIKKGRVKVDGKSAKPAKIIKMENRVSLFKPPYRYDIEVTGLLDKRVSAKLSVTHYQETNESKTARALITKRNKTGGVHFDKATPTSRQRKQLSALKHSTVPETSDVY